MKILVVGSGGREHALVWKLARDGHDVVASPGNPGSEQHARCVRSEDPVALALAEKVELVVVGPEQPLVDGLADRLRAAGVPTFGPGALGARLEGSKAFSKDFFARHGIPTAPFRIARTLADVEAALAELGGEVVVKADGLAAGKGVVVAASADEARSAAREMLEARRFGDAGASVIVERRIRGREVSVLALTDGKRLEILPCAEDHKQIFDGDRGPNTGGMGTVCPAWPSADALARITAEILEPTLAGLAADGIDYRGVLYAGVMIEPDGAPWLLEYNCRFGDPETQPILARARGDLAAVLLGAARGDMPPGLLTWDARVAVCVVVAAAGYPGTPRTGDVITGLDTGLDGHGDDVTIFHAGTARRDGEIVSAGGRVLGVTALGLTLELARDRAYAAIAKLALPGAQFRRDIGLRQR